MGLSEGKKSAGKKAAGKKSAGKTGAGKTGVRKTGERKTGAGTKASEAKGVGDREPAARVEREVPKRKVPTRAGLCPGYVRGRLTDAIEKIADGFVKQAAAGSCQHLKLASELLEKGVKMQPRLKSSAERFLEELEERHPGRLQEHRRTRGVDGKYLPVGDTAS